MICLVANTFTNKPFSVLMSIYKNEKPEYLRESLDSILNNTVQPNEIVMVKDGPLPNELEQILEEYQNKTKLFHFVIHNKNQGLGISLRDGLLECKYELVARMDTDDVCNPKRFQKQLNFLKKHPEIVVVGSNVMEFESDYHHPSQYLKCPESYESILKFAKLRNPLKHPTVMFKKSAVLKSGNYQHFLWFEDYDLCVRMLLKGYRMANIQEFLVYCRADKDLFKRRGGIKYLRQDLKFERFLFNKSFINSREFLFNCSARTIVRLLPNQLRKLFYTKILRSNAKGDKKYDS